MAIRLVIGQKRYSSWSLRPWLLLKHMGVSFEENVIAVEGIGYNARLLSVSPSGLVPCLIDGDQSVWDSMAIAEFMHERLGPGKVWPADPVARTHARCISAEMHSGFPDVRAELSMNIGYVLPSGAPPVALSPRCTAQLGRIFELWRDARTRFGVPSGAGPFLFGAFSAADAMYAPIAFRIRTYGVRVDEPVAAAYVAALLGDAHMSEWERAALVETDGTVAKYDATAAALGCVPRSAQRA